MTSIFIHSLNRPYNKIVRQSVSEFNIWLAKVEFEYLK